MFETLSGQSGPEKLATQRAQRRNAEMFGSSIAAHVSLLAALLHSSHFVRVHTFMPGTRQGTRIELSYLPGGRSSAPSHLKPKPVPVVQQSKLELPPREAPAPAVENSVTSTSSPSEASTSANDALGTDDIRIALTTYSPSPKPDLSRLPRGAQGDVVLDVTIDPTGNVADLQILHALGYGVEGAVADTVRTWKFQPATKDGVPVASVQELHFHYGPV